MKIFTPCKGKTACRDDGENCLVCGRGLQEIEDTRRLIDALAELGLPMNTKTPVISLPMWPTRWRRKSGIGEGDKGNTVTTNPFCKLGPHALTSATMFLNTSGSSYRRPETGFQ